MRRRAVSSQKRVNLPHEQFRKSAASREEEHFEKDWVDRTGGSLYE
jgi:hypothetical protein